MTSVDQLLRIPVDRVILLSGVGADELALAAGRSDTQTPAVVVHPVGVAATSSQFVRAVLDRLETAAIELFPGWLPDAEHIGGPAGAGLAAVRALADAKAARSPHYRPFFSALAAAALAGTRSATDRLTPRIRAVGLSRVVAEGLGRERIVLAIDVTTSLDATAEQRLVSGCEWLADNAKIGVWVTGSGLTSVDWLSTIRLSPQSTRTETVLTKHGSGAVAGKPHPASAVEALLESVLAEQEWASGRRWNQTYQSHVLTAPVRLDLCWPTERCAVELDGPEHREALRFEMDRQRDVRLQLDGYTVLRFTNARVSHDVHAVAHQIGTFIQARRRQIEGATPWLTTISPPPKARS